MKIRRRLRRYEIEVSGWRYTRHLLVGVRRGEWWIGARRNFACDWWEIGLLGLTLCIPNEKTPRRAIKARAT